MDEILKLAEDLGGKIAEHKRCVAFKQALEALKADADATQLEKEYADAARTLQAKASAGQPLEPAEKRLEAELRGKMASNKIINEFLRAQADFAELMQKTNKALESAIDLE